MYWIIQSGPLQNFHSADSVDEAEVIDLNYPIELVNSRRCSFTSRSLTFTQERITFYATMKSSTKERSRRRFSLHRKVHGKQWSFSIIRIWREERKAAYLSTRIMQIQVTMTSLSEVSNEPSFPLGLFLQLWSTKQKVNHLMMQLDLIWIANFSLTANPT